MLTSIDELGTGSIFPPSSERERLTRYEENRKLFEGSHNLVYKNWIKLLRDEQQATLEIILNWHKRLSTLWADLLLGEPPRILAGERGSKEEIALENIISRNNFLNTAYEVALDISRYGTGIFKVRLVDGKSIVEAIPPSLWFPIYDRNNIKEVTAHVIGWTFSVASPKILNKENRDWYLRLEIHEKGKIINKLFLLDGEEIKKEISIDLFEDGAVKEQETGVNDFLVFPAHNVLTSDRGYGIDDYVDIDTIIQELEMRISQISKILDKHSDPNMAGPETALEQDINGQWVFRGGGKYFPLAQGETPPQYITWDGQLDSAYKEIEVLMEQLYTISETSPACFGELKTGIAESGSALKRLLLVPLAKVNRMRMRFDPAIKKTLKTALKLEGIEADINIGWNDGLPQDDKEQAEIYSVLYQNGLVSLETAIRRLFEFDSDALEAELARIRNEGIE